MENFPFEQTPVRGISWHELSAVARQQAETLLGQLRSYNNIPPTETNWPAEGLRSSQRLTPEQQLLLSEYYQAEVRQTIYGDGSAIIQVGPLYATTPDGVPIPGTGHSMLGIPEAPLKQNGNIVATEQIHTHPTNSIGRMNASDQDVLRAAAMGLIGVKLSITTRTRAGKPITFPVLGPP